tara:strand:+ start:469 stop:789 length:321 start_codon:yes stop_codon:yes gene_type:complete
MIEYIHGENPFIKETLNRFKAEKKKLNPVHKVVNVYFKLRGWDKMSRSFYKGRNAYPKLAREAKQLLEMCGDDLEDALWSIDQMKYLADRDNFDWSIITCLKHNLK